MAIASRPKARDIHGILLLDKAKGETSNFALQKIKRLFQAKKAGHTGSLDPIAEGVLPICFGEATKFSQFLLEADKYYRVRAKLGEKTITGDCEGEIILKRSVHVTEEKILQILPHFIGLIEQIPPMYSALKHQGKALYTYARQGIDIARAARQVTIYDLKLLQLEAEHVTLEVHCSKGTYIRTLVEDITEQLECGAHVVELRRLKVGTLTGESHSFAVLEKQVEMEGLTGLDKHLLSIEQSVSHLSPVQLTESAAFYISQGQAVFVTKIPVGVQVQLFAQNRFIGIGQVLPDGRITPVRLVRQQ